MKKTAGNPRLNYSVLLFVTLIPLAISRPISTVIENMGRNSVWYVIPAALLTLAGASISLQISKRSGGASLLASYGAVTFRWLNPAFSFLYGMLFVAIAAYAIGLSGDFSSQALQYGDARAAMLFEAFLATGAALFPMETMIRFAQLITILTGPFLVIIVLPMLMNAQWSWLLPVFDTVAMSHPASAFAALMCIFSPIATVTLISRDTTHVTVRSLGACLGIVALFLSYLTVMSIATFGIHSARTLQYLFFYTQSAVTIERLPFQRLVFINSLMFVFLKVVANAFLLRSAALCLVRMLGIRLGGTPIALTGGIVAAVLWKIDLPFFFRHTPVWLGYYSFLTIVLLPAFIYAILLLRRKPG